MRQLDSARILKELIISENADVSTIAKRNASGDITVRLIRQNYPDQSTMSGGLVFRINNAADNYLRVCNDPSAIKTWLNAADSTHNHDTAYVKLNESIVIPVGKRIDLKNGVPIWGFAKNSGAPYNLITMTASDTISVGDPSIVMTLQSKDKIAATIVKGTSTYNYEIYHTGNLNPNVLENRTTDPTSPATGYMWLRTDL